MTFLFSDIEASTRRWEGDPDGMARDLAHHDELLRAAVERAGGQVFGHTGDGMCAVFPSPPAALTAAVLAQQALAQVSWAAAPPLRIRMAVHSGAAQRRAGNYFGPTLNRAARLMAIGHGGQVLCSKAAADLVDRDAPPDVDLIDLGEHRLADLARPERVFQVTHPALARQFPPLRSLGTGRHNLPVAQSPFVGRAAELSDLRDLLQSSRLLTLTGVGGGGKTRLAVQAAAAAAEHHPDGVWIVELAPLRDDSLVAHAVATAVGVDTSGLADSQAVAERLFGILRRKRELIVFDNCEHLADSAADLIHDLLSHCPGVNVLATSREALGLPGEVVWRVPPLSLPPTDADDPSDLFGSDAVMLFCERARATLPEFELTSGNAADVVRVCRRLDGIPLAVELAAARIRTLTVHEVAERLDDCFGVLTGGAQTAWPRHQTLQTALDWSYQLLDAEEQTGLRRLAVFAGSFEPEAAGAAIGIEPAAEEPSGRSPDAREIVRRLIDKSFVTVLADGGAEPSAATSSAGPPGSRRVLGVPGPLEPRYRLLEPVRQYGLERLMDAGEDLATRRRHRDFFVALDGRWPQVVMGPAERVSRIVPDRANLRAALEWSWAQGDAAAALQLGAALWQTWFWEGEPDACEWLERLLTVPEPAIHPARARVLCGLAILLRGGGRADPERLSALIAEALRLSQQLRDPYLSGAIEMISAQMALGLGETERARKATEKVLTGWEELGYVFGASGACDLLGWIAVGEEDFARARGHFERAAELARQDATGYLIPRSLSALAPLLAVSGEPERSLEVAEEAVFVAREIGAPGQIRVMALTRAAETALLAGNHPRAVDFLSELLALLRDLGTRSWVSDALEMVAVLQDARGQPETAAETLGTSSALREAMGETGAGRVLAAEVRRLRHRLETSLGAGRCAEHETRGRMISPEAALGEAVIGLKNLGQAAATGPAGDQG